MNLTRSLELWLINLTRFFLTFTLLLQVGANSQAQSSGVSKPASHDTASHAAELLKLSSRQNLEDHALALETARAALALSQTVTDNAGIARAYVQIGQCYLAQSDLTEAQQNHDEALRIWRALNEPREQAGVLIQLGFIENRQGEWTNSISLYTQAQSLIDETTQPFEMGQIALGLADIFDQTGLPESSLLQYQRALEYFRRTPDTLDDAFTTTMLGSTYYLLKDYSTALANLQEALLALPQGSLYAALCEEYIGMVYGSLGEYADALRYLTSARTAYTHAGNQMEAARVTALLGQVFEQQGNLERARKHFLQALNLFKRLSDRINQAAVSYALGRLELNQGHLDEAENYLQQSLDLTEDMRRVPTSRDLTTAFSATVHERYESYIECLMRKHQIRPSAGLDVRAFEASELARGRALAELLRATQTNLAPNLDRELAERETLLRQSLRAKEDYKVTMLGRAYKKEGLDKLEAEVADLRAKYQQVTETIKLRYPSYDQISRPEAWHLLQIQQQAIADDQTVLLEYNLGAKSSYVWVVTRDHIMSYELPSLARINDAAQKVYRLLAAAGDARTQNELSRAAQELSQMILLPVAAELNKQRVIVVADGALNYIPFQILPVSPNSDEPFVAKVEVVNAPSASILGQLREEHARRRAPSEVLAAFGDPVFASNYAQHRDANKGEQIVALQVPDNARWQHALRDIEPAGDSFNPLAIQPLFYSKLELANLREVAGPESFVATGFDASREKLAAADLSRYAILHFATHGILDPKRPENSGLFLSMVNRDGQAENGFLGLQDIYRLQAPVDLVVLSACRTGLGKDVRGEGLIGLTRGFMYAGASSVVASLWKVDDEATSELMKRFYVNLLQHSMTPAAALREAQNSIRKEPQWSAPYYWAAFTLQGDHRQVVRLTTHGSRLTPPVIFAIIALGGLITILSWWYFSRRARRSTLG